MESVTGYLLERGAFGTRAVLTSDWGAETERSLLKQPIAELELNQGKGWQGRSLEFLSNFPELLALSIIGRSAEHIEPIHRLHNLKLLRVLTYCKNEIRFHEFPRLIDCGLQWRPKAMSLFDVLGLRVLFVNGFNGTDTRQFGRLTHLESLTILGSPISSLEGLATLLELRSLRLGELRKLLSLSGIENLLQLEKLQISTCRKIRAIDEISSLSRLQELYVDNMGDIKSLKPLAQLRQLHRVTFVESTNILDGDLTPLVGLPSLESVSFQNRRHYSHRREEFRPSTPD
jgi:Leucine-rich repeat (LRR) protein